MNLDRYVGYDLQLYTDLNVGECVKRLRADFKTPRVRILRETVADNKPPHLPVSPSPIGA